jgi:hypothetical protein
MSRFSWRSCETPFSTLKWWFSVPRSQVRNSETEKTVQIMRIRTVHCPPRREGAVYEGFVLAGWGG